MINDHSAWMWLQTNPGLFVRSNAHPLLSPIVFIAKYIPCRPSLCSKPYGSEADLLHQQLVRLFPLQLWELRLQLLTRCIAPVLGVFEIVWACSMFALQGKVGS